MRITAATRDAISQDVRPVADELTRLAKKHGVRPHTIYRHAMLLPVPVPGLVEWNERVAADRSTS